MEYFGLIAVFYPQLHLFSKVNHKVQKEPYALLSDISVSDSVIYFKFESDDKEYAVTLNRLDADTFKGSYLQNEVNRYGDFIQGQIFTNSTGLILYGDWREEAEDKDATVLIKLTKNQ